MFTASHRVIPSGKSGTASSPEDTFLLVGADGEICEEDFDKDLTVELVPAADRLAKLNVPESIANYPAEETKTTYTAVTVAEIHVRQPPPDDFGCNDEPEDDAETHVTLIHKVLEALCCY